MALLHACQAPVRLAVVGDGELRADLEAAAAALLAVATAVGGVRNIVRSETGRLVAAGDAAGLAGAIAELVSNPELGRGMGAHARAQVVDAYSAARLLRDIGELYERLLSERSGAQ